MSESILTAGPTCQELAVALPDLRGFVLAELNWDDISFIVCGLTPGWDHAVALTAIEVGKYIHVVIPYSGWEMKFSASLQKNCRKILDGCHVLTYMGSEHVEGPANHYMVSLVERLVVLGEPGWNNERVSVGTLNKKPITNLWQSWIEAGLSE